ncbi:MAG: hypothetical protein WAQ99_09660 [Pyrinomonadaceae bacterium]
MSVHRMMPNPLKHFAIEYSIEHNEIHRSTLDHAIENNLKCLRRGWHSEYMLVGLLPSLRAADWYREQFNLTIAPQAQQARANNDWQMIPSLLEGLLQQALDRDAAEVENSSC